MVVVRFFVIYFFYWLLLSLLLSLLLLFLLNVCVLVWEIRTDSLFTTVLAFDDGQGEDEEGSLPHIGGFGSKLPPGILPHGLPQVKEVQPAVTAVEQEQAKLEVKKEGTILIIYFRNSCFFWDNPRKILYAKIVTNQNVAVDR